MSKDPLLVNKVFAAILAAAWTIVIAGFGSALLYHPEESLPENAYPIAAESAAPTEQAAPEQAAAATPSPAEAPAPAPDIATLLAAADAEAGAKVARKCSACHTFDKGGANRVGPNLWNIVDRPMGSHEGYNYSSAMAGESGNWTYEKLNHFLASPKDFVPGTKMTFAGIKDDKDRTDLIAYLRTLSDNPAPLP